MERVTFGSGGVELVGHLRLPQAPGPGPWPGIVLTGPLTGVKEQVTGGYAARLSEFGFATLAFDHRNFGESGGTPRQHEDSGGKLADLTDALTELAVHPDVDAGRLGVLGICLGGGYAVRFAATDPRVAACAVVAGCFNDPAAFRSGMGPDNYRRVLRDLSEVATHERASGEPAYLAAVADGDGEAAMPGREPYAYYGTERAASPHWQNRVTRRSIHALLTFDAASWAERLPPTPLLVVHGRRDDYCAPDAAERLAAAADGELVWLETDEHVALYDDEAVVEPAVHAVATFFDRVMPSIR
ncbi:alpha/beta hydrolase [Egicoccus sp. AB-alg6-2]|uniref:alpha/beta hydrolase n=1 Tax=Egicoccus sp. AB-alg6-2 TaxID=3242692 RepID=UPI00359CE6A3